MTEYTPQQLANIDVWIRHAQAEFVHKDPHTAIDTMGENPYIIGLPTGQILRGREEIFNFYAVSFLPNIPDDFYAEPISRVVGDDILIEEFVNIFTHSIEMPWMLPGIPPTGKKTKTTMFATIGFKDGKLAYEHLFWDHAALLQQIGLINHPTINGGVGAQHIIDLRS